MASFFLYSPIIFNTLSPAVHKLLYAHRKEFFWLDDKPHMHPFFHFMVTGEMAASQSVSEQTKLVIV
jgi:hypothetical protein